MRQEKRTKSVLKQYAEQRKLMYSIVLACAIILMCCYLGYCFGRDCAIRDNAKETSALWKDNKNRGILYSVSWVYLLSLKPQSVVKPIGV